MISVAHNADQYMHMLQEQDRQGMRGCATLPPVTTCAPLLMLAIQECCAAFPMCSV